PDRLAILNDLVLHDCYAAVARWSSIRRLRTPSTGRLGNRQAPLESRWLPPRYLAFVLCADEVDKINMIDIGGVDSIDRQIGSFRTAITGRQRGREIEAMQQSLSANTDANLHGKRLRESILDKIVGAVGKL